MSNKNGVVLVFSIIIFAVITGVGMIYELNNVELIGEMGVLGMVVMLLLTMFTDERGNQ